jgi:ribonuclease Z
MMTRFTTRRIGERSDLSVPRGAPPMGARYDADAFGRFSEAIARFLGTGRFLFGQTVLVVGWIILNSIAVVHHWDPYPFILLNLAFSTQAAYAAPLILLAQNRQDDRDRANIERDREVASRTQTDTEYLARELAAVRLALNDVVTTRDLEDTLSRLSKMIADQQFPGGDRSLRVPSVANRELVVLGTASQAPTRTRNHNGYFLRWDDEGLLFDPGEGTQRQMLFAGVTASQITRVCVTHFHGDHCLGLPGVLQRMSLDRVAHPVAAYYPGVGAEMFGRLRHASLFHDRLTLLEHPVDGDGTILDGPGFRLEARALSHLVPTVGYRLVEPDGRRMLPGELAARGIAGPDVGRLQRSGRLEAGGRVVTLEEVSVPRRGQRFAFVMDTRLCDAAFELADGADMLVCESTFADADAALARDYGHLTARQAGEIAAAAGARLLVLTHFSQRYEAEPPHRLRDEAAAAFGGEVVLAADLDRIDVPKRAA